MKPTTEQNLPTLEERIKALLNAISDPKACRGCGMTIYFVRHKNGRATPYTADGVNHFINCSKASQFKRPPSGRRYVKTTARYAGDCSECRSPIEVGDSGVYDTETRKMYCAGCGEDLEE